jgi:ABC-type transport system involved in multi-copper enzyme maturation permease subunit
VDDTTLDTRDGTQRIESYGRFRGLRGLTAAESARWFPLRSLTFTALGLALLVGNYGNWLAQQDKILGHLMLSFLILWVLVLILMTVAATQSIVAGEIAQGTAAWVVAKPVGTTAFVISKFAALIPVVVVAMVGVPGVVARFVFVAAEGNGRTEFTGLEVMRLVNEPSARGEYTTVPDWNNYLGTLGLLMVIILVIAAAMVLLGCVLRHATAILAVGLMVPIAMVVLALSPIDHQIVSLTPAWLMESFIDGAGDDPAPVLAPVGVGLLWIAGLLGVASWRFNRREL